MVKRFLVLVGLAWLAALVVKTVKPDVDRYLRISRM
ncbi:DUF6893 family small protein [Amycolatopsis minnesotensis]